MNVKLLLILLVLSCYTTGFSQVGINTDTPSPGALLDINSDNKGLLITRVALTNTNTYAPITPATPRTTGLLVYNTNTSGSGASQVSPGFYYWSGMEWRRFLNQGYELRAEQTDEVRAVTGGDVALPGLSTGQFTAPFSGTYQVILTGYYSAGANSSILRDGAAQASLILALQTGGTGAFSILKENYVTSSSKFFGNPLLSPPIRLNYLAQSTTIVYNIDLIAGTIYNFVAAGNEWATRNTDRGWFGKTTDAADYIGTTTNNAQRGTLTVTLVRQF